MDDEFDFPFSKEEWEAKYIKLRTETRTSQTHEKDP
jgi:hypothetical protein